MVALSHGIRGGVQGSSQSQPCGARDHSLAAPTAEKPAALARVSLCRAVHGEGWVKSDAWAIASDATWCAMRLPRWSGGVEREFSVLHRRTGLLLPGIYGKTLRGVAPVLAALEHAGVLRKAVAGPQPGDVSPSYRRGYLKGRIRSALRGVDLSGVDANGLRVTFQIEAA